MEEGESENGGKSEVIVTGRKEKNKATATWQSEPHWPHETEPGEKVHDSKVQLSTK